MGIRTSEIGDLQARMDSITGCEAATGAPVATRKKPPAAAACARNGDTETRDATLVRVLVRSGHIDDQATVDLQQFVPSPYTIDSDGIGIQKDQSSKPELIAGPLIVTCLTRGTSGHDYGLQIVAEALDGQPIHMNIPATQLYGDPAELSRVFADVGVRVVPKQGKALVGYLDAARANAAKRKWVTAQPRLGWSDGDSMAYIFPEVVFGASDGVFQPERANRMADCCTVRGALPDWQRNVAAPSYDSDLAVFVLCASFAGAIVRPAGIDSFGFNLAGLTSRGKTTALQIAASVWGNGAEPGSDPRAFCRRWTATANALEAIAEEHSDMVLCLDEIGSFRHLEELGRSVYNLVGGRGAERLNSNAQRRVVREWRTIVLSTGEISIREVMSQRGQRQRGGQALRVLDIPFPQDGLFPGRPDAAKIVRKLKRAASEYYGIAGRKFVQSCIDRFATHTEAQEWIRTKRGSLVAGLAADAAPEIARAADRFALVCVAGILAVEAGVLQCPIERIHAATRSTWALWRAELPEVDDGKRAIAAIADFIKSHPGLFPPSTGEGKFPYTVAGYLKTEGVKLTYLFTEEGFASAIGDISMAAALGALEAANLLINDDPERKMSKHPVAVLGEKRYRFYAIRGSILAGIDKSTVPNVLDLPDF